MKFDILYGITSPLITIAASIATYLFARTILRKEREEAKHGTSAKYQKRMKKLTAELARASAEVDNTLREMETVSRMREEALKAIESKLGELDEQKNQLQTKIDNLKNVPLPAVDYFAEITEKTERRSVKRDIIMLVIGIIASTIIQNVISLLFSK
ncbi:MAG: hypothetical protein QOJ02_3331 [Acidobacteriota bacterium]|jgi:DNA repair exonuclease SbcCD ATPase subunit|nr:hypothetical protein [Acidobacteriota bacterium]